MDRVDVPGVVEPTSYTVEDIERVDSLQVSNNL